MMKSWLDNPNEPVSDMPYFECLDTVIEKSKVWYFYIASNGSYFTVSLGIFWFGWVYDIIVMPIFRFKCNEKHVWERKKHEIVSSQTLKWI